MYLPNDLIVNLLMMTVSSVFRHGNKKQVGVVFSLNSLPDKEGRPPCNCQETAITLLLEIDFIQSFVWFDFIQSFVWFFFASGIFIFLDNLSRTRNFKFFKILKLNKCFSPYLFIIGTEYIILLQANTSLYCLFTKLLSKFQ